MSKINVGVRFLDEILDEVNASENPVQSLNTMDRPYLKEVLSVNVSDVWPKFDVDNVVFTQFNYHRSMAGAFLLNRHTWNILDKVLLNQEGNLSTKEKQFKALSEMICVGESNILRNLLKKNLTSLYPNITHEVLCEYLGVITSKETSVTELDMLESISTGNIQNMACVDSDSGVIRTSHLV